MNLFQAIILGIVQGATEYIPVSSSAHLVLVPWLLGWPDSSFAFEVLVQLGTLVGVFIFFWADLWAIIRGVLQGLRQGQPLGSPEARLGWLVVVATIPAVVLGLLFKDYFEQTYDNIVFTAIQLAINGLILVIAEYFSKQRRGLDSLSWLDAIIIGFWQAAAILPGISRSGATIGGAMLIGITRPAAARFSFIMSIPALLGAGVVALSDLLEQGTLGTEAMAIVVGFVVAAITGYICIRWLLRYLQNHSLYVFAAYCFAVSLLTLLVAFMRG
jgi:undecaprenyl-diphosphatase